MAFFLEKQKKKMPINFAFIPTLDGLLRIPLCHQHHVNTCPRNCFSYFSYFVPFLLPKVQNLCIFCVIFMQLLKSTSKIYVYKAILFTQKHIHKLFCLDYNHFIKIIKNSIFIVV